MVHREKIWRRQHQGSAALITTIAVSAILVVLFVGITTIATREIRQSINADNANRALYAAEAGVEDAVRRLADDPRVREENCNELASPQGSEVPVTTSETIRQMLLGHAERLPQPPPSLPVAWM
jgi:Tfp pilus assembly protein PilX